MKVEIGKKVKYLKTDNELEFYNDVFNKFYGIYGITRHRIVFHNPIIMAKRMIRNLLERVSCMLLNSGLQNRF